MVRGEGQMETTHQTYPQQYPQRIQTQRIDHGGLRYD